jgi:hypothetical protein
MDSITAKLDELGRPAWVALMVVSFILFWPAGLAVLAYMIWSKRMGCSMREGRWTRKMERMQEKASRWYGGQHYGSSGNSAFDEYRDETLRRLEEEQREFREFLERLRHAKDKAEFDQFMADRRRHPEGPATQVEV